ncbi:hypothetical protein [Streptomyces sp. SID3343]|uniref:hypothetical protein n=1 Tax=Streptomyces sp. SID3343 TaxID=2690260 RepID=UPI001370FA27|nr:hypothetical protein [Streptomyces sp. SID3343]MYW04506.1 hypothetical protein [Streptomyces sp. SID3343]
MNVHLITASNLAADPAATPAGGSPVLIGSGLILAVGVYFLAKSRGAVFLALIAFLAGVMLAGSSVAVSLAQAADHVISGMANGVIGIAS